MGVHEPAVGVAQSIRINLDSKLMGVHKSQNPKSHKSKIQG